MVNVAERSSYVVLALQRTETVTGVSDGSPDDGDNVTQESELLTLQALFAVKVIEPLLPSALNSMLAGLVMVSSGAFWQEGRRARAQRSVRARVRMRFIVVSINVVSRAL